MKQLFGVDSFLRNLEHLFQQNKIGIDEVFFYPSGKKQWLESGADSERGDALSLRDSTPYRPKGSPSVLIWCQYILILRGSTRQKKKRNFFVKIFQVPKNGFLFKNLPAAQTIWPQQCLFSTLGELGKSIWSTLKNPYCGWNYQDAKYSAPFLKRLQIARSSAHHSVFFLNFINVIQYTFIHEYKHIWDSVACAEIFLMGEVFQKKFQKFCGIFLGRPI